MAKRFVGDTVNLLDPAAQLRFQAALLARRHRKLHYLISRAASASGYRELSEKECRDVVRLVEELGCPGPREAGGQEKPGAL